MNVRMFSVLAGFLLSTSAFAANLTYDQNGPTMAQAVAVTNQLADFITQAKGLNGIGVTACDTTNGTPFINMSDAAIAAAKFVNCVGVYASDKKALTAFQTLYPNGTKYNGIYIYSEYVGEIKPQ